MPMGRTALLRREPHVDARRSNNGDQSKAKTLDDSANQQGVLLRSKVTDNRADKSEDNGNKTTLEDTPFADEANSGECKDDTHEGKDT